MAKSIQASDNVRGDYSEWREGPWLIAVRGDVAPDNEYRLGTREYDWHHHVRGQVFCVETGLIHVQTSHGSWLLPPHRAGWMPPAVPHRISIAGALSGWSLFVAPEACDGLPPHPCVIGISEVMQALARRAVGWNKQEPLNPEKARIAAVMRDEIARAPHESLHLPMPTDPRLARVARAVLAEPGNTRTLEEWAAFGAMSARTMRRLILAETGLTFAQWRQQAQLTHALEMLARGVAVAEVADALGYASPSNFIAMFRRAFGDSPARYFSNRQSG